MPELPEVETICRRLRQGDGQVPALIGRRVMAARVLWAGALASPSLRNFRQRIQGQVFRGVTRRGKYLLLRLSRDVLVIHLRMSGSLILERDTAALSRHCRLLLRLGRRWRLLLRDPRKFGRVWLTGDPSWILDPLGPEPLARGFTAEVLHKRLSARRRQIKPLLLDQSFIAGLGNIYADESLHRAGIHPLMLSGDLTLAQARLLWRSIRRVLTEAIRHSGTSFDSVYGGGEFLRRLRVYRRMGQPCRRCGTPIERITVGQRGTHYCPRCQVRPRANSRRLTAQS